MITEREFSVPFAQRVLFSREVFAVGNGLLSDLLSGASENGGVAKVLVFVDSHVVEAFPELEDRLLAYAECHAGVLTLAGGLVKVPGGEACKNDFSQVEKCWKAMHEAGLDRHSFVFVIGGGAVLDLVCFAAATAHRGIRHVRFPTTTLSQGDGGVGVKNGVNYFGKKNWIGTFAVPFAIVNDFAFLDSLPTRERRCGLIEAVKVALIRDAEFYHWIEANVEALAALDSEAVEYLVKRSAELHVEHIVTNGDPFEQGSARPLDFGHWAAHKLEQVSGFAMAHGEAVAIGMALDLFYSVRAGLLDGGVANEIVMLIEQLGFETFSPYLQSRSRSGEVVVLEGLEEFREHLGGELTVTLVPEIGKKVEVHEMDRGMILEAVEALAERAGVRVESVMEQAVV
ncbi:3-dehydroquinate synthase [Phragmitibacter flavus]|uniref:3-dehydroquinate synthase n=1 Tax=Phragmitibacter flavus TaxID=2576071 RepID=UPI00140A44FC|nr:3-dehydroquinate synthase [Phragmitibacter flavus]